MSSAEPTPARVAQDFPVSDFDLAGCLRRIRRVADLSQRELAEQVGLSKSALAAAESGTRDLPATRLARAAALAGLRLALIDTEGCEISGMTPAGARDGGNRRLPAHLDTVHSDEVASRWEHRRTRPRPWFTFAMDRQSRDRARDRLGIPADHQVPQPGDSPSERAEARRRASWRRRAEERQRRFEAGELRQSGNEFVCTCPAECDELDDRSGRPVHAPGCVCNCDVG
jgi:transcriptional regulator with XRE-family HTH domain